jgi:hypothetical protein
MMVCACNNREGTEYNITVLNYHNISRVNPERIP